MFFVCWALTDPIFLAILMEQLPYRGMMHFLPFPFALCRQGKA